MKIVSGKVNSAQKVVIYGPEGIGKTTFASKFPDPLFIDTEGGTKRFDVKRTEAPSSWQMLLSQVRYVVDHPDVCKTLVIDTADWAERLCILDLCARAKKNGIESFGYGKGYTYAQESFAKLLTLLDEVLSVGIHVVITAHASIHKFDQPDELGSYDRWELKLTKRIAPMVKEWADMVLFANYKTIVVNVDGQGVTQGKNKAQGGKRVLYTEHTPSWDAKNREGFPSELPFEYSSIAGAIEGDPVNTSPDVQDFGVGKEVVDHEPEWQDEPVQDTSAKGQEADIESVRPPDDADAEMTLNDPDFHELKDGEEPIPMNLGELMRHCKVTDEEIRHVVNQKGYYPEETPIAHYDQSFVNGVLIGAWEQVFGMIKDNRKELQEGEQVAIA